MAFNGVIKFDAFPEAGLTVRPQNVYVREAWGDSWTHVPNLYCDECTWSVAPQTSTAVLRWRFGQGTPNRPEPGKQTIDWYDRLVNERYAATNRWYVLVTYDTHQLKRSVNNPIGAVLPVEVPVLTWPPITTPIAWVGTLEQDATALHGAKSTVNRLNIDTRQRRGEQQLICYGLERTLAMVPIDKGYWFNAAGRLLAAERPFVFNAPDAVGKLRGNYGPDEQRFSYKPVTDSAVPEWSTRKIVKYLLQNFRPKSASGRQIMSVTLGDENILPDNDRPTFDPTAMNLWECLCNLMARQRLLGFYLKYNPGHLVVDDFLTIEPYTLVDKLQQGEDYITIPANKNQVRIDFDLDSDVQNAGIKYSSLQEIDQLVLRGARRTSTCSLSNIDGTLKRGWNVGSGLPDEEDYEAGGSTQVGYAALGVDEKQRLNAEVRSSESLHSVYRLFVIPGAGPNDNAPWDQFVLNGEGGGNFAPLFPIAGAPALTSLAWPRELYILPGVLLEEGLDYSYLGTLTNPEAPNKIDNRPRNRTAPLVFFKVPKRYQVNYAGANIEIKDRYWIEASKIGEAAQLEETADNQNHRWSCRVEVPNQSYGVLVHVEGQPQHVIAKTDFTKLPVDEVVGDFDWREMIITCSFEDDRYCEGKWPPDSSVVSVMADNLALAFVNPAAAIVNALNTFASQTQVRRHVIYVGDEYRQDYLCPNTVVGVNAKTGALIRNPNASWIRDDSGDLQKRARQMFQYFGKRRRSLTFSSSRINTAIELGYYVISTGSLASQLTIGSVVTQIRVTSPEGEEPPRITYETSYLELEAIQP